MTTIETLTYLYQQPLFVLQTNTVLPRITSGATYTSTYEYIHYQAEMRNTRWSGNL